jgi:hypothetical protein
VTQIGVAGFRLRVASGFYEELDNYLKNKNFYLNSNRVSEKNIIIESAFITFKYTGASKF